MVDLPDSYFAPTASEAQKAFSGQQAARERLTDAPMLTKTLRDREEKAKKEARYKKYPLVRHVLTSMTRADADADGQRAA